MEFDFYRFDSMTFENMIQALAQNLLGRNSIVFGPGPDGGRELTYSGEADFPNSSDKWSGKWLVQAKYKTRDHHLVDNFDWISKQFKDEMKKLIVKSRPIPDNYLFFTNACLTAVEKSGGRDKMEALKKKYTYLIPNIEIISYDELCAHILNNESVRKAHSHLLTPGDIFEEALSLIRTKKEKLTVSEGEIREKKIITNSQIDLPKNIIISIDFGTSYTLSGISAKDSKYIPIPSDKGQIAIPSVVTFFKNGDYMVGNPILAQLDSAAIFSVKDIKRAIGTGFRFKVFDRVYSPEEVISYIYKSVKANAEEYLGFEVKDVILSKPANFNLMQEGCLRRAAERAGLNVRRILNEASSACLVYKDIYPVCQEKSGDYYVTVDLGGGTFDIAIVNFGDDVYDVKYVQGDNDLGGLDFDKAIYRYIRAKLDERKISISPMLESWLAYECERVKKTLTTETTSHVVIRDVDMGDGNLTDYRVEVSRAQFEELTKNLIVRIENHFNTIFSRAASYRYSPLLSDSIKTVLLTGQGTKIFNVAEYIHKRFPKAKIHSEFAENAVVTGITINSGVMTGTIKDRLLLDVHNTAFGMKCMLNHSLFVKSGKISEKSGVCRSVISTDKSDNELFEMILEPDTTIPTKKQYDIFFDNRNSSKAGVIELYEFSNSDNRQFLLSEIIVPLNKDVTPVKIAIDIDANGIINLILQEESGAQQKIVLNKK